MRIFRAAKLPASRCAVAALLLGVSLAGCATPRLSLLGLGQSFGSAEEAKAQPKTLPAQASAPDPLADVENTIRQAQALRKAGEFQAAARTLSQLVIFVPDNPRLLGEYGKVLVALGRSDDALAFLERAVQLQPGDWSLYSAQGVAYDAQGKYQAAQTSYMRALALKPGEPAVLNNAALSYMQSGDLAAAEKLLLQVGMNAADYPRIAQNLTLVQSLKAARAETAAASVVAQAEAVKPAPPPVAAPEPAPVAVQAVPQQTAAVQTVSLAIAQAAPMEEKPAAARNAVPPKPLLASKPASFAKMAAPRAAGDSFKSAIYVQAGAYGTQERAGRIARDLDSLGARVSPTTVDGRAVYRVRIGPFLDVEQASMAVAHAKQMGHADLKIVPE